MLALKPYQKRTLEALEAYLENARISQDPKTPFEAFVRENPTDPGNQTYRHKYGMENVPYVCLRLPTGAGKTFLASHCVAIGGRAYLEKDFPVVLWLVPTNAIRTQTIEALKRPSHPYREAIDDAFDGKVAVFDISEVERIRPQDLLERVCVIVGTLATLRVRDTDGRRIYAHNENFEPHFSKIPMTSSGLEKDENGQLKFSFVNILHQLRPLILMDEAHKAGTDLTNDVMIRLNPACVIEFTATPIASNILYRVTASELKAEEMIKLPIILTEHGNWQNALRETIFTLNRLQKDAESEQAYLRPIALIQAENKSGAATVEEVKKHLIENEKVGENEIAIATGSQRELDGINLFKADCPIRYVITVQALKEGWDCPFAYVFCSVAHIRSAVDTEQFLGRVLRMPYAKRRANDELNKAYAHVISTSFAEAVKELETKLTNMGFQDEEAEEGIQPGKLSLPGMEDLPLFRITHPPLAIVMENKPEFLDLGKASEKVKVEALETGGYAVRIEGEIDDALAEKVIQAAPAKQRMEVRRIVEVHRHRFGRPKSPSEKGDPFRIPRLCVEVQGELELAEPETFLDSGWSPLDYPTTFAPSEFSYDDDSRTFSIDIKGNRVFYKLEAGPGQHYLPDVPVNWTDGQLIRWLDKLARQQDIPQPMMLEFIRKLIDGLMRSGVDLPTLLRAKFALASAIVQKVKAYRADAYKKGFQLGLFGPKAKVETSFTFAFNYDPQNYPAKWFYRGNYRFSKHFYPFIGELEAKGEEFECAQILDAVPQVKHWVRNIAREESASFWLPTSTDKFYPDFVAELIDGRILVLEYKGEFIAGSADTLEKKNVGELWEEKSNRKGIFLMAVKKDANGQDVQRQIQAKIGS